MSGGWYVYIVAHRDHGPVKIGRAKDPSRRLGGLQNGNPEVLRVWHAVLCQSYEDAKDIEYGVHQALSDWRKVGEWFDLPVRYAEFAGLKPIPIKVVPRHHRMLQWRPASEGWWRTRASMSPLPKGGRL